MSVHAAQWLRLAMVRGIGPVLGRKLINAVGGVDQLWLLSATELRALHGVGPQLFEALQHRHAASITTMLELCSKHNIGLLCPDDTAWPTTLSALDDAPLLLFYQGDVSCLNNPHILAIVGARKASRESMLITRRWSRYLSANDCTIISGMAYGIDAAAHGGTLEAHSPTVAVLGCGLQALSEQQLDQAHAVAAQGCVLSEFFPKTSARPEHFPRRNRIIAGLSHATLVMQANVKSGSLITARQALEYGRDVFAVPGSVMGNNHTGCHQLIREGAILIEHASHILQDMGWKMHHSAASKKKTYLPANSEESTLLQILSGQSIHLDHLAESCGLTVPQLSPILLRLELQGVIERLPGSRYLLSVELEQT